MEDRVSGRELTVAKNRQLISVKTLRLFKHHAVLTSSFESTSTTYIFFPSVVCLYFQSVGCDNKLESGVKYDHCGVCGGDSSTCNLVRGEYTLNWRKWGKIQTTFHCRTCHFSLRLPIRGKRSITINKNKVHHLISFTSKIVRAVEN